MHFLGFVHLEYIFSIVVIFMFSFLNFASSESVCFFILIKSSHMRNYGSKQTLEASSGGGLE